MMSTTVVTPTMMSTAENVTHDMSDTASVVTTSVMSTGNMMHCWHVMPTMSMHHYGWLMMNINVNLWNGIAMRGHGTVAWLMRRHVSSVGWCHHGRHTTMGLRVHHVWGTVAWRRHHAWRVLLLRCVAWRSLHLRVAWWCSCAWWVLIHNFYFIIIES